MPARMTRRRMLTLAGGTLGLTAAATLLAACGGSAAVTASSAATGTALASSSSAPASSASATTSSRPAASAAASPVAASAAAPANQKITLEHLDWWAPSASPIYQTYFDGIKADFEAKNPNVTITYVFAAGGTTEVRQKWIVNTAGGTPHDTSQVSVAFIRDLMNQNLMEPLDAYLAKTSDMALSNFVDSGLTFNTYQGKHYGIPYDGPTTNTIAYNTDHFTQAGLDPSRDFTWKWTYQEFIDAAKKLTKTQGSTVTRGGFQPVGYSIANFLPFLYANGGQFYDSTYTHIAANDDHGAGALQFMVDLSTKYGLVAAAKDAALENEGYSMVYSGSYTAGTILQKNPNLHFGYAPIPQGPQGQKPSSQTWTNQWSINAASKNLDASWQWLSLVNSEATLEKYFAGVLKRAAARKAFYQSQAWMGVLKIYPQLQGLETIADVSGPYPWVKNAELNDKTAPIWKQLSAGNGEVAATLTQLQTIGNQVLAT